MTASIERKFRNQTRSREQTIKIFLNEIPIAVTQGTPEDLAELAVGFLLFEGLLSDREALVGVEVHQENQEARVTSTEEFTSRDHVSYRVTSAGCAQPALLSENIGQAERIACDFQEDNLLRFRSDDLLAMMEQLCYLSPRRNKGECVHACGLGNGGELVCVREDIGRHNAMDKLIGRAWLDRIPIHEMALCATGRISYEMALKAVKAGIPVLVSHKSVTDSAIELAEEQGLTLVGRCRDNSMEVLSHHDRVV